MNTFNTKDELIFKDITGVHDLTFKRILQKRNKRSNLNFKLIILLGIGMIALGIWLCHQGKDQLFSRIYGQSITANYIEYLRIGSQSHGRSHILKINYLVQGEIYKQELEAPISVLREAGASKLINGYLYKSKFYYAKWTLDFSLLGIIIIICGLLLIPSILIILKRKNILAKVIKTPTNFKIIKINGKIGMPIYFDKSQANTRHGTHEIKEWRKFIPLPKGNYTAVWYSYTVT